MAMQLAPGVQSWILFPGKDERQHTYLVGSLEVDKYLVVPAAQYPVVSQILEKLPTRAPDQIGEELKAQGISTDVGAFCRLLSSKGLLAMDEGASAPAAQSPPAPKLRWYDIRGHLLKLRWELFTLPLDKQQRWVALLARWYWGVVLASAVLTTLGIVLLGDFNWIAARRLVRDVVAQQNVVWMALLNSLLFGFFALFHEAGHAAAAAAGGVYPRKLTCRLLLLMPYFSLQLPGLHTLPLRRRLLAMLAGPLVDLTLGNALFLLAHSTGPAVAPWIYIAAFANYGRGIFNLVPFLPFSDGYAFMSQGLFREMDIRGYASREVRRWRKGQTKRLDFKSAVFTLLNAAVILGFFASLLIEANNGLYRLATKYLPWQAAVPDWAWLTAILAADALGLYLARNRLKSLLGW